MQMRVMTDFGEHVVPETVRAKIWDKVRDNGQPDRRYRLAPVIDRYFRLVSAHTHKKWKREQ